MYHVRHACRIRHTQSHVSPFSGGGPGMENADDGGKKASADLEVK